LCYLMLFSFLILFLIKSIFYVGNQNAQVVELDLSKYTALVPSFVFFLFAKFSPRTFTFEKKKKEVVQAVRYIVFFIRIVNY